jgi:hypothetical protein
MYILPDTLLWETHIFFNGFLDNQFQIPFLGPFHSDEELIQLIVDEPVEILDNVRVV